MINMLRTLMEKVENTKDQVHYPMQAEIQIFLMNPKMVKMQGFPSGAVVKNPPANAGDTGSSPSSGRSHMPQSN